MFNQTNTTVAQGGIGLAKAIYEYQKQGYTVVIPLIDAQSYDLVIEKNGFFQSVQCRTTSVKSKSRKGGFLGTRYEVNLRCSRTNTKKTTIKKRGKYDILFVLCENGDCYSIPSSELPYTGTTVGGPKYKKYQVGIEANIGFVAPVPKTDPV